MFHDFLQLSFLLFAGWGWGDPHITMMDGTAYTFNGLGEYMYIISPLNEIHARFLKAIDKDGKQIPATVFVAFAGKNQNNYTFHVSLNTDGSNDSKHSRPYFKFIKYLVSIFNFMDLLILFILKKLLGTTYLLTNGCFAT